MEAGSGGVSREGNGEMEGGGDTRQHKWLLSSAVRCEGQTDARQCGEQTNELHISRRERKGKRRGRGRRRKVEDMGQEGARWRQRQRDERRRGEMTGEVGKGREEDWWEENEKAKALHLQSLEKKDRERKSEREKRNKRAGQDKEWHEKWPFFASFSHLFLPWQWTIKLASMRYCMGIQFYRLLILIHLFSLWLSMISIHLTTKEIGISCKKVPGCRDVCGCDVWLTDGLCEWKIRYQTVAH